MVGDILTGEKRARGAQQILLGNNDARDACLDIVLQLVYLFVYYSRGSVPPLYLSTCKRRYSFATFVPFAL
jgi:hypothetical protein